MEGEWNTWIGKKVYVVLKSGRKYAGHIKTTSPSSFTILDKFNQLVFISVSEISSMEEEQ